MIYDPEQIRREMELVWEAHHRHITADFDRHVDEALAITNHDAEQKAA